MSARHGRPRIQIKVPRKMAKVDLEATWAEVLSPAVAAILERTASSLSFEDLYNPVYLLVGQHHGRALYKLLQTQLKEFMTSQVYPQVLNARNDNVMVELVSKSWKNLEFPLKCITDIFMYLDRAWCLENDAPIVEHAAQLLFRDEVLRKVSWNQKDTVAERAYVEICRGLDCARKSDLVDGARLRGMMELFALLPSGASQVSDSMYADEFEDRLITASQKFYESESDKLLSNENSPLAMLQEVCSWLDTEESYADHYIPQATTQKIIAALEENTVMLILPAALDSPRGLTVWIEENNEEALSLAATIEARALAARRKTESTDSGSSLRTSNSTESLLLSRFCQSLRGAQQAINDACDTGSTKPSPAIKLKPLDIAGEWVRASIALSQKYSTLFATASQHIADPLEAQKTLTAVWSDAVNKQPKLTQNLVLYLDDLLKKSPRSLPDQEIEQALDGSMVLFDAIADKDKFSSAYSLHLARRLLNNRSQSEELEQSFISKLKSKASYAGTQHFDGMFKDMRVSRELQQEFKKHKAAQLENSDHSPPLIPTRVNVLTLTMWSSFCTTEKLTKLPPELERARQSFHDFYVEKYQSRKLRWNYSIGSVDMNVNVPSGTYNVTLSLYAVAIMNLFQGEERLSLAEIAERAEMPEAEAVKQLQALALAPRSRLLLKEPPAPAPITAADVFYFNSQFTSSQKNVKVVTAASVTRTETQKQEIESMEDLKRTRALKLDAAIVRLMKTRRELSHAELVQQVTGQLLKQFKPSPASIKQRIASLIETEYLARDSTDPSRYIYLA